MWRRVVASPEPQRIFEIRPIRWLLERGAVVICTGGGGIPTMYQPGTRTLVGAEVVIDKDRASALLARELEADLFVMATDVDAVYLDFGTPQQAAIERATATELAQRRFAAGSMGPKVEAAVDFVERTGKRAAIGTLADLECARRGHPRHQRRARLKATGGGRGREAWMSTMAATEEQPKQRLSLPSAYTILFILIVLTAIGRDHPRGKLRLSGRVARPRHVPRR